MSKHPYHRMVPITPPQVTATEGVAERSTRAWDMYGRSVQPNTSACVRTVAG
jgi:hypothetical protein